MSKPEVLQQKLEHWCATSIRAITNDSSAHYRGHHLFANSQPQIFRAPYLQLSFDSHQAEELRGVADSNALRLLHSDAAMFHQLCPQHPIENLIFDLLEQARCESLAPESLQGIHSNLRRRFLFWASQNANSELTENQIGILLYAVNVVCWSRLLKAPIPIIIEDTIEATRYGISSALGAPLLGMTKTTREQRAFSVHSAKVANIVNGMIEQQLDEETTGKTSKLGLSLRQYAQITQLPLHWLNLNETSVPAAQTSIHVSGNNESFQGVEYKVFSTQYDRIIHPSKEVRPALLKRFRSQLDKRIALDSINCRRLAQQLRSLSHNTRPSGWSFGEEEGHLDAARIARLMTSPSDNKLFKRESNEQDNDCVVTLLVDNSGSMTTHAEKIAAMVDTFCKALHLAQINSEVLGFTTGEWNGGKVAKLWRKSLGIKAGQASNPGRLNSLNHIIYKSANTPWRRSRTDIAALLKSDSFRESIDGEALLWAASRLNARPETTRILMVISDGSPLDTATVKANDERYLDRHLAYVAQSLESDPNIKLCALGVGLDLSQYYSQCLSISLSEELQTNDYIDIATLLAKAI